VLAACLIVLRGVLRQTLLHLEVDVNLISDASLIASELAIGYCFLLPNVINLYENTGLVYVLKNEKLLFFALFTGQNHSSLRVARDEIGLKVKRGESRLLIEIIEADLILGQIYAAVRHLWV
jgi:hypothetical protein